MRHRNRDRGASLVEFALVLPILALFLLGIVQFGVAYDKKQSINSAAREGARIAALDDTPFDEIVERSVQAYSASAAPGDDPTVEVLDAADIRHGYSDAGGSYTDGAGNSMGSTDAEDPTLMPCGRATPSAYVTVVVATPYDITIPFFGVQSVNIEATAEFRCE